jgi:HlyD family secretion protein
MKKIISFVVVLLAVAGIGLLYHKYYPGTETELILYGNVDIREVDLGFRVAGRLSKLFYDEGDNVKTGEVIARLDDEPYRDQVASAVAQVNSQRERLKLRETGNRPQEIAQARSLVREREASAANAKRLFQRSEKSLDSKGISAQDRDNAEAGYREAEARLTSAKENLALLEAGFRIEDIAQAKADLAQAEAALAGAVLSVGETVFTVSLQNPVWVRAYVHEPDLGHIHPGTKVKIYTDSRPDKPYSGQIGFISPRAEFTPKTVETTELRTALVYRLRIVVDNPDQMLRQGMPVTIKLTTDDPVSSDSAKLL